MTNPRKVSVGGFHPILTRGNRVGYRNQGVKDSAGFLTIQYYEMQKMRSMDK